MPFVASAPERTVEVTAQVEGHLLPTAVPRVSGLVGIVNGAGVGASPPRCRARAALPRRHLPHGRDLRAPGAARRRGRDPLRAEHHFIGPGASVVADGSVSGLLAFGEVGGGVTLVPAGTGDRLRLTGTVSAALGWRGDEVYPDASALLLSPEASRMGVSFDVRVGYRFAGIFVVDAGLRAMVFPAFGSRGRQFSYLGAAGASTEAASLLQVAALIGLGVEP
ncbi:MAG: hypothetical protein R3A48_11415 [Polyangiales bacterium]